MVKIQVEITKAEFRIWIPEKFWKVIIPDSMSCAAISGKTTTVIIGVY